MDLIPKTAENPTPNPDPTQNLCSLPVAVCPDDEPLRPPGLPLERPLDGRVRVALHRLRHRQRKQLRRRAGVPLAVPFK